MGEAARSDDVPTMAAYLRDMIAEIDDYLDGLADLAERRKRFAMHLAVLEAGDDKTVRAVAADYERRVNANESYEDARPAEEVLREAHGGHAT